MSIAVMMEKPPQKNPEKWEGITGKSRKELKDLAKRALLGRYARTGSPQPEAKKAPTIAPESEQVKTLIGLLRDAASEDEMHELLNSFQDYAKPEAMLKALTELPIDKQDSLLNALDGTATPEDLEKYRSSVAHTREKVEDKEKSEAGETPQTQEPKETASVSEAPRAEPEASPVVSVEEAATTPKTETPVKEESATQIADTPAGTDYYEFLKSYVEGRAQRRQVETEEQGLQGRLRRRPKKHPARRAQEEREETRVSTAPEFPPTEEMQKISAEIDDATDQAYAAWQRLIAYKELSARTLQKAEEVRRFFLRLERLRNRFEEAKARGRTLFEKKGMEKKKSHGPTTRYAEKSPNFGMSIGEELEAKGVPIFRGEEVLTPKELREFLKERKISEKQNKLERQQEKRSKKDALWLQNRAKEIAGEHLEKAEEAFGKGELNLKEFTAKRDFTKRLGAGGDVAEVLDIGLGEGALSPEEYQKLKSVLVEKSAIAEKKETLEELEEALGRGEIKPEEFLRRKQRLH